MQELRGDSVFRELQRTEDDDAGGEAGVSGGDGSDGGDGGD